MLEAAALAAFVAELLEAAGATRENAETVADALVQADLQGTASHGTMLLPLYLKRIAAGSVDPVEQGILVSDRDGALVMDARNALGQVTATRAAALALERARIHGIAAVAVRNASHFGTAGRWAEAMAKDGCVGVVMSNTRPLMPAPGGAERVVGNNPIAIAAPAAPGEAPVVVDLALSAAAMGKIRLADAAGEAIPPDWAADAQGMPTTDPAAAIAGMLLPAGGAKGFGLAMMVDILAGGLSAGAIGAEVRGLYGDPAVPYRCAQFFLALDVAAFRPIAEFGAAVTVLLSAIRNSRPATGGDPVRVPGEGTARRRAATSCRLADTTVRELRDWAIKLSCRIPPGLNP